MILTSMTLGACATDPLQAYPEAKTPRECQVLAEADENARGRAVRSQPGSGNALADLIGRAVGAGVVESQIGGKLEGCIARVGGGAQAAPEPQTDDRAQIIAVNAAPRRGPMAVTTQGCRPGFGVLQRGSLICPGF